MSEGHDDFRDKDLDQLLKPLKEEAVATGRDVAAWQAAVARELNKPAPAKKSFIAWPDALKVAAGIVLGIGIGVGASAFQRSSHEGAAQENFMASATVQYPSAKASD